MKEDLPFIFPGIALLIMLGIFAISDHYSTLDRIAEMQAKAQLAGCAIKQGAQ